MLAVLNPVEDPVVSSDVVALPRSYNSPVPTSEERSELHDRDKDGNRRWDMLIVQYSAETP